MTDARSFSNLVVVGSSSGGIEALSRLAADLPEDFPAPVVFAQHLHPERESHLAEILSQRSRLPVRTVTDHRTLEAATIFVVPADRHVNITDREIEVHQDGHGRPKPSIDLLLSTAAEVYGDQALAVILSGTGSDGTEGSRLVNKAGGTVVVQDPETAEYPEMPDSVAPNTVDIVSDLGNIGRILADLLSGAEGAEEKSEERALDDFLDRLRRHYGVDFGEYKKPTILRRLQRRFAAAGVRDLEAYQRYLDENPDEYRRLVNTFLIKVTEFFRDPEQFEYLRAEILPELVERARREERQLRLWSAGCATGEEAYSLAILVAETLGDETTSADVRIFATDLDEAAVDYARRATYPLSALSGLSDEQISRYFDENNGLYQVKKHVRSMIVFGEHDLGQRAPFPRLDLVMSNNVLIYFTTELQKRALQLFAYSLRDGGYLMLGKAESAAAFSDHFELVDRQRKVYRRQGGRFIIPVANVTEPIPDPPRSPARRRGPHGSPPERGTGDSRLPESPGVTEEGVLNRLPVGVLVVDESYDIRALNSAARRLLSIHSSALGEDLLHLAREAPYDELRAAIDSAFREDEPAATGDFEVAEVTTGESRYLQMFCYPWREAQAGEPRTVSILVHDVTEASRARRELEERLGSVQEELERVRREAEREARLHREQNARLIEANRQLETTDRELSAANEELQGVNEQYLVATEEAQATNEELETLNEELQATNEELETLNEELQATVEELNTTNEDLQARSTELQHRGESSRQERARLSAILENIPEAVLVVNARGEEVMVNEAYRETFGPGGCVAQDESGADLPEEQSLRSRAANRETFTTEFTALCADGSRRRFQAKGSPVGEDRRWGGAIIVREIPDGER